MKVRSATAAIALHDLSRWRKMPLTAATALVPPLAMMLILATLSLAVTQQPVALVVQGNGPSSARMAQILENDTDAYFLTVTNSTIADSLLASQQVAAVITIPSNFDSAVANGSGKLLVTSNNVDYDFSDDLHRSVDRSIVQFDAPGLVSDDLVNSTSPNVYRVALQEVALRQTNVDWFHYQLVPTFILLTLNVGLVGTAILCAMDDENKTNRMLILSPQRASKLVFGRILGGVMACIAIVVPAIVLSVLLGFVDVPAGQIPDLLAILLGTAMCAAGTGAVIGTLVRGTRYVAFLSSITATYLFFLGGGFTAIEFVPDWLKSLSAFIPTRYSIDAMRQSLFYPDPVGLPFAFLVLGVYAAGCVAFGAYIMRRSWLRL